MEQQESCRSRSSLEHCYRSEHTTHNSQYNHTERHTASRCDQGDVVNRSYSSSAAVQRNYLKGGSYQIIVISM